MKKLVAVLLTLVAIMSLSASAFAQTANLPFDPNSLYAEKESPKAEPEAETGYLTLDDLVKDAKALAADINKAKYEPIPTDEYTATFYVDPSDGFAVRKVIVKATEETPYIKSFYYDANGNVVYAIYETKAYENGDQHVFYFAVNDTGANELVLCKIIPFGGNKVTLLTEGDGNFDTIESTVLAESAQVLGDAQAQLALLQTYGYYK